MSVSAVWQTRHADCKYRVNMYKLREERDIKPATFSAMISSMLYSRRYVNTKDKPVPLGLSTPCYSLTCIACVSHARFAPWFVAFVGAAFVGCRTSECAVREDGDGLLGAVRGEARGEHPPIEKRELDLPREAPHERGERGVEGG